MCLLRPRLSINRAMCRYEVLHSRCSGACPTSCSPGLPGLIPRCDVLPSHMVACFANRVSAFVKPRTHACIHALAERYGEGATRYDMMNVSMHVQGVS